MTYFSCNIFSFIYDIHIYPKFMKYHYSELHKAFIVIQKYNPTCIITFFGFNPCLNTCSRTIKKCCKGILSESNIRPYLSDVSISSLTISFDMLTKLLLSIITGSRAEIKESYLSIHLQWPNLLIYGICISHKQNCSTGQ